jgi:hypothetical protein
MRDVDEQASTLPLDELRVIHPSQTLLIFIQSPVRPMETDLHEACPDSPTTLFPLQLEMDPSPRPSHFIFLELVYVHRTFCLLTIRPASWNKQRPMIVP